MLLQSLLCFFQFGYSVLPVTWSNLSGSLASLRFPSMSILLGIILNNKIFQKLEHVQNWLLQLLHYANVTVQIIFIFNLPIRENSIFSQSPRARRLETRSIAQKSGWSIRLFLCRTLSSLWPDGEYAEWGEGFFTLTSLLSSSPHHHPPHRHPLLPHSSPLSVSVHHFDWMNTVGRIR